MRTSTDTVAQLRTRLARAEREAAAQQRQLERYAADLAGHIEAGEAVIGRIAAIVSHSQPSRTIDAPIVEAAPQAAPKPVTPKPAIAPVAASPNGERLGVAAAAALAMSERALGRLRSRAA